MTLTSATRTWEPSYAGGEQAHSETKLADGRPGLLVDPGSKANLCGSQWAEAMFEHAVKHKEVIRPENAPTEKKRTQPMNVCGVGNGAEGVTGQVGGSLGMCQGTGVSS